MTRHRAMRALVAIPCFNEAHSIVRTLDDLRAHAPEVDMVVIDDGSDDGTSAIVRSAPFHGVTVVRHAVNLGYGSAIQTAARYALDRGYDAVVFFDGDGQHSGEDVPTGLAVIGDGGVDVGVGSRFLGSCAYRIPFSRRAGMAVFRTLLRILSGLRVTDPTSGFEVLDENAMRLCASESFSTAFPDADMLLMYHRAGLGVAEFPASFRERSSGDSMHSVMASFYYIYKMTISMIVVALTPRRSGESV